MDRLAVPYHRIRRRVLARRRLLAALCAAGAVAAGMHAVSPPPPPTEEVLAAARDIPGGVIVRRSDLTRIALPPDVLPSGLLGRPGDVVGRTTAGPVRAGEPITDVRLVHRSLLDGYPGMVAAPVRIGDPGAVALLRVGDRVDVLAADPRRGQAQVVASGALVLSVPEEAEESGGLVTGGLLVLAVPDTTAQTLASVGVSHYLSVVVPH